MNISTEKDDKDTRTPCRYGSECYQRNKHHLEKYKHPSSSPKEKEAPQPKKPCKAPSTLRQQKLNSFFQKTNSEDKKKVEEKSRLTKSEEAHFSEESEKETKTEEATSANSQADEISESVSPNTAAISESAMDEYQRIIRKLFLVDMPPDFFSFWEFCKSLLPEKPTEALQPVDLSLVGPFDVLAGVLSEDIDSDVALRHWRYYYDPPEFQTVLKSNKSDLFHVGYYRDEPNSLPVFVGYNYASKNATITSIGDNLFAALSWCMKHCESAGTPFKKVKFASIKTELQKWAGEHHFSMDSYTASMRARDKNVVAKTFHHAGIVVPYNKETELGYRPLSEKATDLTKILKQIDACETEIENIEKEIEKIQKESRNADKEKQKKDKENQKAARVNERSAHMGKLHSVINWANIAVDEGDYGTSLELGIDLFCFGTNRFNSMITQQLTSAYNLLGRESFLTIIKAHLKDRKKGGDLSVVSNKNVSLTK